MGCSEAWMQTNAWMLIIVFLSFWFYVIVWNRQAWLASSTDLMPAWVLYQALRPLECPECQIPCSSAPTNCKRVYLLENIQGLPSQIRTAVQSNGEGLFCPHECLTCAECESQLTGSPTQVPRLHVVFNGCAEKNSMQVKLLSVKYNDLVQSCLQPYVKHFAPNLTKHLLITNHRPNISDIDWNVEDGFVWSVEIQFWECCTLMTNALKLISCEVVHSSVARHRYPSS